MRRATLLAVVTAVAATLGACASKVVPAPALKSLAFPDFDPPAFSTRETGGPVAVLVDRSWRFLQAGDLASADREARLALRTAGAAPQSEAMLGYVSLARQQSGSAVEAFDRALVLGPGYLPALTGRGQALALGGREDEALAAFRQVLAIEPSRSDIRRRLEVLEFRRAERQIGQARQAVDSGQLDAAAQAYESLLNDSPDSPFLHREFAAVEAARGSRDRAVVHLRTAARLEPDDASTHARLGELLEAGGDLDGALEAYETALRIEPTPARGADRDRARAAAALRRLPPEYGAIGSSAQVTRAELAALIGVRLGGLVSRAAVDQTAVVTDVRGTWAESWVAAVSRAGVMEPYPNHTFLPRAPVRRIELAQIAERLLALGDASTPAVGPVGAGSSESRRSEFIDLTFSHGAYRAAVAAVRAGVLAVAPSPGAEAGAGTRASFRPNAAATGAEALHAIDRLAELTGAGPLGAPQP